MGNSISLLSEGDPEGVGEELEVFRTMNVKWMNMFVSKLRSSREQYNFSIEDENEKIQWREYFQIFTEIKVSIASETFVQERINWHPATLGYAMIKKVEEELQQVAEDVPDDNNQPPDDYTDDEPSEIGDDEAADLDDDDHDDNNVVDNDSSEKPETSQLDDTNVDNIDVADNNGANEPSYELTQQHHSDEDENNAKPDENDTNVKPVVNRSASRKVQKLMQKKKDKDDRTNRSLNVGKSSLNWSPIYIGYSTISKKEHDKQLREEQEALAARENRAIEKAKTKRGAVIDAMEKLSVNQSKGRLEKIQKVEGKYAENKSRRQKELAQQQRELPDVAFALYEAQWEAQTAGAEQAYVTEMEEMRSVHEQKTTADAENLRQRRVELEAFKEANNQDIPCAERLEEFARIEVSRSIDELENLGREMNQMRLEYREMKTDFDAFVGELDQHSEHALSDKNNAKKLQEMKSMVGLAESRMKEAQRNVREELEGLVDAEMLLNRAVRMRHQQDEILPLFSLIAGPEVVAPSNCGLNSLILSIILLMEGTFDQKYNFIFRLYDADCEGTAELRFTVNLLSSVQRSLRLLGMLRTTVTQDELLNSVTRGFMSFGLNPVKDRLTEYELKSLVLNFVSNSHLLTQVLGISMRSSMQPGDVTFEGGYSAHMGTFQRNMMSPLALVTKGMININMCKVRLHNDSLTYKPELQLGRKLQMHERAIRMGQDDPLIADYTKFYIKQSIKEPYRVPPLDNGHLINITFLENRVMNKGIMRLQAIFRSINDRKIAELAARYQAFQEAKAVALKEMKAKVVREFKKREAGKGMGKMKWDAQVRMKQAKLRTLGQVVSRSDTVTIMMEEAVSSAKDDIELRFRTLEEKEEFHNYKLDKQFVVENLAKGSVDVTQLFGLLLKPSVADQTMLGDDRKVMQDNQEGNQEEQEAVVSKPVDAPLKQELMVVDHKKIRSYILGKHHTPPTIQSPASEEDMIPGENSMEFDLRMLMASCEPSAQEFFFNRLRCLDSTLTRFKTEEIVNEIPSKRLMLQYVMSNSDDMLKVELKKHFKFKKHVGQIVKIFRNLVRTDIEMGTLRNFLFNLQVKNEAAILNLLEDQTSAFQMNFNAMIEVRLQTNAKLNESDIIQDELSRLDNMSLKFRDQSTELLATIHSSFEKLRKVLLSLFELEKKHRSITRFKAIRDGTIDTNMKDVPLELRQNWILRLDQAIKGLESTDELKRMKFAEIRNVCKEFITIATSDAMIIVNELYHPKYTKTIRVATEHKVDGRSNICGRGLDNGHWYTYEAHNIIYRVCLDYDGVFNGSDEYAAKAAGKERLGAQEYFKLQMTRLLCPLTVTIDYLGFRVLATSKLPLQQIVFNDDGEIRKISEDLLHGINEHGDTFVNKSKTVQTLLKLAASKLNLAEHQCKGAKDISSSSTHASSELKVYKGGMDEFYLKDFWRVFPPEVPSTTPHFRGVARDQSVFWRFLRPEYILTCKEPLSPDACCSVVYHTDDHRKHYNHLAAACNDLVQTIIPKFVYSLLLRSYVLPASEGFGLDLTHELHSRGINVRHLGLMRSLLWRDVPGTVNIYNHEDFVRTNQDLRYEVDNGDSLKINGQLYVIEVTNKRKITHNRVPISVLYEGESLNGLTVRAGRAPTEVNCHELRQVLLAEMVARAIKSIVRFQMRLYNKQYKCTSYQFYRSLVCEYLNAVTGGSPTADELFQHTIVEAVRERFGDRAILPHEKLSILSTLSSVLSYLITRITALLGVTLCISCESELHERPMGFIFTFGDILDVTPVVKHNIATVHYADAMLLSLDAAVLEKDEYVDQVLRDEPMLFYTLSERKGARDAENKGLLEREFDGKIKNGCELEYPGPIMSDRFVKAISFKPNAKSFIDVKYHRDIVPLTIRDHFSIEFYYRCTGGKDNVRVMMMCGRYQVMVSRDNYLVVMFMEGIHDIVMKLCPIQYNEWIHIMITYDGTTLRCYLNSILSKYVEVEAVVKYKTNVHNEKINEMKEDLDRAMKLELDECKQKSHIESLAFFQTKDGVATLKRITREIMESDAFQADNIGGDSKDQQTAIKEKRTEGLKRAKTQYIKQHFEENTILISNRYKELHQELQEKFVKEIADGERRVLDPLRIGGALPKSNTIDGSYYFHGQLSCVSIYSTCLSSDRVKDHYLCSVIDRRRDAQRIYSLAASKFELAVRQGPPAENSNILRGYAKAVCSYLRMQSDSSNSGKLMGKVQIMDIIQRFQGLNLCEGIAEILKAIPHEPDNGDLVVKGFQAIRAIDRNFFSKSISLLRKDMVHFPLDFGLMTPESPAEHWEVAALIFSEVVRDIDLMFVYGDLDLRFLPEIRSAPLIISLVKAAIDDKSLKIIRISEMFTDAGLDDPHVSDDDVQVLTQSLSLSEGIDLTNCTRLTDTALLHIDHMKNIKLLNLSNCSALTDRGLRSILSLYKRLQTLSLEGLTLVSDEGLSPVVKYCKNLRSFNVNKCPSITSDVIIDIVKNNRSLNTLLLSGTRIDDRSLTSLCAIMIEGCGAEMVHMDLSLCRDITDIGIVCLSETCSNLKKLNLSGLNRISDIGVRSICANCWYLHDLNVEDIFLLKDNAFFFNPVEDGRRDANEKMLVSLRLLNLTDCTNLTDTGLEGLSERCRQIDSLILRGCERITDSALRIMSDPSSCTMADIPMCDSFRLLNISYCTGLTSKGILMFLPHCCCLEELNLSGLASTVTDSFIQQLSFCCRTLQKFILQKCFLITDASLCSMADNLWLELLDISGCHKCTDAGVEVLSEACSGLRSIGLKGLKRITIKSVHALTRNCTGIQRISIQECALITKDAVQDVTSKKTTVKVVM